MMGSFVTFGRVRAGVIGVLAVASLGVASAAASADTAPGSPGSRSYFDLARKDCVGTARNTTSKVWFTVADGALSDVYWPTVDATNVHSLQYIVSDGRTFTDVQARDMSYRSTSDPTGMSCTVVASDAARGYRITTTYLTDPSRPAVLMEVHFDAPRGDRLYVRLDPLAGGTGGGGSENAGGNSATLAPSPGGVVPVVANPNTRSEASNRDYAVPTYEALSASGGFGQESLGYAGTASDGLSLLDSTHTLTSYDSAPNGHVAATAELNVPRGRGTLLALGFGTDQGSAIATAGAAAAQPVGRALARYETGWLRYDRRLRRPSPRLGRNGVTQYYRSVNVVKASEDKTFPGAIAAGLASPWGQAVAAGVFHNGAPVYFGSYREVFARDLYEAFSGLLAAGDVATARDATRFLFLRQQQPDGSMPRNSLENGKPAPDTGGNQLDETADPILMDWESGLAGDASLYQNHVVPAADFLVAHGPSFGSERWEEQSGYSPSTIAAEIAGLTAAAQIATVQGDAVHAAIYQATADDFARNIKGWTVTSTGPLAPSYFIRLSKTGDPNAAITYNLGNGSVDSDQRQVIDQGFLELVRLGVLPASDPDVQASLAVVDATIRQTLPDGTGFYRYGTPSAGSEDGYGDCWEPDPTSCSPSGEPWPTTDKGSGHVWPVLAGERGEYAVAAGDRSGAAGLLGSMAAMTSGGYLEPEQAWEDPALPASPFGTDPTVASIGFAPGRPAGSASPLTWAQAQYARLALDMSARRDLDTPSIVSARYVRSGMPGTLPLQITSPADRSRLDSSTVTVAGTSSPGAFVAAEAWSLFGAAPSSASTHADNSGGWSLTLPVGSGSTTITVTATQGRNTAYAQRTVSNVRLPGTPVFSVSDAAGDDNGPGTYAYPTASDFHAGAFDLLGLQMNETADSVYIQTQIADLTPTFGSAFGAQLLDLYVRDPSAGAFSTAAPFPSRNYSMAPGSKWSEMLEAQGFAAPRWVDANGHSVGSARFIPDPISGTATLILPRAAFGDVGPGWVFTVVLTGQDGFSPDQARGFAPTPQPYSFGVCAAGETSPICSVDPGKVPKVMDTITPAGVSQATELDPTQGPVQLQGVAVP